MTEKEFNAIAIKVARLAPIKIRREERGLDIHLIMDVYREDDSIHLIHEELKSRGFDDYWEKKIATYSIEMEEE